ncbi:DUF3422 family protein [Rhizobium grahamii]|uniref:DUF3422 family protein n=1 Tax=Rhizobium grahamii TaxID=1120045 RepID=UPI002467CEF5|nr:DUF3422 family protein [Rhizobium grahamii]
MSSRTRSRQWRKGPRHKSRSAVEGFSIIAISYYLVGLIKTAFEAAQHTGLPINSLLMHNTFGHGNGDYRCASREARAHSSVEGLVVSGRRSEEEFPMTGKFGKDNDCDEILKTTEPLPRLAALHPPSPKCAFSCTHSR